MLRYDSMIMLGLGTVDPLGETRKSIGSELLAALKNPVHAALVASAYLIWFLTAKVDASQSEIKKQLDAQAITLSGLVKAEADRGTQSRQNEAILRMICRGVNKGDAKEKCDQ